MSLPTPQLIRQLRAPPLTVKAFWPSTVRYGRRLSLFPYMGEMRMLELRIGVQLHWAIVDQEYLDSLTPEIDAVVDLGSGTGHNLLQLRLNSNRSDIPFFGCEIEKSWRAMLEEARLGNVHSISFDFGNPDFGFLDGAKRVLVLSHSALVFGGRQRELWEALFQRVVGVKGCLLEHVSFAIPGVERPLFPRATAELCGHNLDLFPTLAQLAEGGSIQFDEIVPDMTGVGPGAAVSLIRFHRVPAHHQGRDK